MIFDHKVNYAGVYYDAGMEVPIDVVSEPAIDQKKIYTYEELSELTVKEIKRIALDNGLNIKKTAKDDVINEFLSMIQ